MRDRPSPRILIVDDSPVIRKALSARLKEFGAVVAMACDGQEGYETACSGVFDLVITDVDMPRMTGIELCGRLKATETTKTLPVIILSSRDREEDIENGFRVGAAAYVSKSHAQAELPDRIRDVLDKAAFLKGRLVLVADGSQRLRRAVCDGLAREGFHVEATSSGKGALEILARLHPDLVLLDMEMEDMDGATLCRTIKADDEFAHIPVVAMGASGDRAVMRRMLELGAATYLPKPFNIEQTAITFEKLLSDQYKILMEQKQRLNVERDLMVASIASLVKALEARDQYTRGHSESVERYSLAIARVLGFSEKELERLALAARLHDLGKIGIRDTVLLKPGRLTDEEYEIIKTHPTVGAEILAPIPSFADVLEAAASHHERYDGSGSPRGISGEDIPLWARIIAVADTYDALTSDRPYRKGMPRRKALSIIAEGRGTQWCPVCVDAFLAWMNNGSADGEPATTPTMPITPGAPDTPAAS